MRLAALLRPPVRPLITAAPKRVLLATGALGYLDAADDDRRRWIRGFRALLDGLSAPLQVLIRCSGRPRPLIEQDADQQKPSTTEPPPPGDRRRLDLEFARSLRRSPDAQRRDVLLATPPSGALSLERALTGLGLPSVCPVSAGSTDLLRGVEAPGSWWDDQGLHRTWYVERFPGGDLEPGWLLRLIPGGLDVSLSWHAERLPADWVVGFLQRQLVRLKASELSGPEVGDPAVAGALPSAEVLQRRVAARQESAFRVALYVTVSTHGPRELAQATERIEAAARSALCLVHRCTFRQLEGRLATLPLGVDPLGRSRILDTSSLATFFPWFDADLQEPGGLVVGTSRATGQPVLVDPFDERRYANANVGVFGHSGAGKTYLLSSLAMSAHAAGAQVFVIDPEHEYGHLAEVLGGLDVRLALGSEHSLNVLDLRGRSRDEAVIGPAAADAADLCAILCGGLDEAQRAELELAARRTFEEEAEPTLADVADRLDQGSRAAQVLRRWSRGSLGRIFSSPTTIDLEAPVVVFGMRELRPEMVAPVHFLLAEALWTRIKHRDRRRVLLIDELGLLFEDETIRRFVVALARRIRKYHGSLVFATQNPGDLLSSEAGAVVATNPAIHFFGAQRPGEAARLQAHFELSDRQRVMMESAARGEFLLAAGADRIPLHVKASPWQAALLRPP
jgi:conjugal transfer ATP-binding protein TraC